MRVEKIEIFNYKGLFSTKTPLSNFVCVVGENNTGKSSLLQSLLLFIKGRKLTKAEFYNPTEEILITVEISGLNEKSLNKLAEEHRSRILPYIENEKIILARRYSTDGSSKLRVVTDVPIDLKFSTDNVNNVLKGKTGTEIVSIIKSIYPEISDPEIIEGLRTQKAAKELIQDHINTLPTNQLTKKDIPLPTGFDNSLRYLLPEPIYIPAVKDLSDELKTKESASFGKLLNILLDVIEENLIEAVETFENLRKKLNRITLADGTITDMRMDKVKEIESTIQTNLQETFRNVSIELEIPPPEIKTVLSNANIIADDGVRGPVENKGDGFKRAIVFSILRSYVQLSQNTDWRKEPDNTKPIKDRFLFLFEEPELYLHPRAQNILFDALALISKSHQVIVTTHSPLFFSSNETRTFVKMSKRNPDNFQTPIGECLHIDLTDISDRDKFQIISFETSNLAFFSEKIVLVEGDSELIVLPHIAKLLNSAWDFKSTSTNLVKVSGKGSFLRYKKFFECFDIKTFMISDLDILINDFNKIEPSQAAVILRDDLLHTVDKIIAVENESLFVNRRLLLNELQKANLERILRKIIDSRTAGDIEAQTNSLEEFFSFEKTNPRLEILKDHSREGVLRKKRNLLARLRREGVFVLEKGAIEDYYPDGITGRDKPSKAQSFCAQIHSPEDIASMCNQIIYDGGVTSELELIISEIFNP